MGVSGCIVSYQATSLAKVMTSANLASWRPSHVQYSSKVVAIMSCHGVELQRRAARTEPEWTFANLYSSLLISDEYQVLDIKIRSDGKTECGCLLNCYNLPSCAPIFQKNHVFFRVARDETTWFEQNTFSMLIQSAHVLKCIFFFCGLLKYILKITSLNICRYNIC